MISIIICSANKAYLEAIKQDIAKTIGCEHEILAYKNSNGEKGICEIYNQGVADAKYEILCFMHEDIAYKTQDWGQIVLRIFRENPSLGLLGVAGGDYKSLAPSSWFSFAGSEGFKGKYYINLLQGFKFENRDTLQEYRNPYNERLSKVACLDGVWLCSTKEIFSKVQFDDSMLKGFHGYDLDLSMAVNYLGKDVAVTYEILLHHFSEGKYDKGWYSDIINLHKKWAFTLPISYAKVSTREIFTLEKRMFRQFIYECLRNGYSKNEMLELICYSKRSKKMSWKLFLKIAFSIVVYSGKK
ncbi:glycosyltransferase [Echinicola strongylocentroti]|nr:glycosyltransferase [Echinicola strongylocentroti]